MMSVESIVELSRRAGNKARRQGVKPFVATAEDLACYDAWFFAGNIPNMGGYRPRGWTMVAHFQIDKMGVDDGLSMGVARFKARLLAGYGYAMIEESAFQAVIGEFIRA